MISTWHARLQPSLGCVALVLVVMVLTMAGISAAAISSVTIDPPDPAEDDSVTIEVTGWFPDGCWSLSGFECGGPSAGQMSFDVYAADAWVSGVDCTMEVIPYAYACAYDPLPAGHYVVTVTEHHDSLRDPLPDVVVIEFDVAAVTPVGEMTWGGIRALYR